MVIRILSVLAVVSLLSGCGAAVVAGAAGAGYYVGKDERTVGQITDDASIITQINAKYARDDLVSAIDVNVDCYNGKVTLYGNVKSQKAAERAVTLARSVKGVSGVNSKLTVVE